MESIEVETIDDDGIPTGEFISLGEAEKLAKAKGLHIIKTDSPGVGTCIICSMGTQWESSDSEDESFNKQGYLCMSQVL